MVEQEIDINIDATNAWLASIYSLHSIGVVTKEELEIALKLAQSIEGRIKAEKGIA